MSAGALATVNALHAKAQALVEKRHHARAAEKYGEAVAAAQALGHPECLVVAHLQVCEAEQCCAHLRAPGATLGEQNAALNRALPLLGDAGVTLLRRHMAGTLLPDACRPLEDAFYSQKIMAFAPQQFGFLASYIGYESFLHAGTIALSLLELLRGPASAQAYAMHAPLFTQLTVHAARLSTKPRSNNSSFTMCEYMLAASLRNFVQEEVFATRDAAVHETLLDAWTALQRSGVVQSRGMLALCDLADAEVIAVRQQDEARYAAATLSCCALASCGAKEVHAAQYKKCGACKTVVYCCREHQVQDWPAHKKACKAARKAEVAGDGSSSAPSRGE